jgi:P27 family predicted phage terminase small subunit
MPSGGHNKKSQTEHWLRESTPAAAPQEYAVPAATPKPPKGMVGDAKKLFKQLARQLAQRRAATAADTHLLGLYVDVHQRAVKARAMVAQLGEVLTDIRLDNHGTAHEVLRKSPWLAVAQESERQMHSILRDLGLTPNARTRVKPTGPVDEKPNTQPPAWLMQPQQPVQVEPGTSLDDFEIPEIQ